MCSKIKIQFLHCFLLLIHNFILYLYDEIDLENVFLQFLHVFVPPTRELYLTFSLIRNPFFEEKIFSTTHVYN